MKKDRGFSRRWHRTRNYGQCACGIESGLSRPSPTLSFDQRPFGGAALALTGEPLPQETLKLASRRMRSFRSHWWSSLGKRTDPEKGLLNLRQALGLYANIRPIKVVDAVIALSPIKEAILRGQILSSFVSWLAVFILAKKQKTWRSLRHQSLSSSRDSTDLRKAFEIARTRKKRVLSVDKANVLATSRLWRRLAEETAQEFPDCQLTHQYVDSAAMKIIQNPKDFDVIVTENLFGDILSDEAPGFARVIRMLPSASHGAEGFFIWTDSWLCTWYRWAKLRQSGFHDFICRHDAKRVLQEEELADTIESACYEVMNAGILTRDLGGTATTTAFTEAVIAQLEWAIMGKTRLINYGIGMWSQEKKRSCFMSICIWSMKWRHRKPSKDYGKRDGQSVVFATMDHNVPTKDIFTITDLVAKSKWTRYVKTVEILGSVWQWLCQPRNRPHGWPRSLTTQPGKRSFAGIPTLPPMVLSVRSRLGSVRVK